MNCLYFTDANNLKELPCPKKMKCHKYHFDVILTIFFEHREQKWKVKVQFRCEFVRMHRHLMVVYIVLNVKLQNQILQWNLISFLRPPKIICGKPLSYYCCCCCFLQFIVRMARIKGNSHNCFKDVCVGTFRHETTKSYGPKAKNFSMFIQLFWLSMSNRKEPHHDDDDDDDGSRDDNNNGDVERRRRRH